MTKAVSVDIMRASDRATIKKGTSGIELMGRAAKGIYNAVRQRVEWKNTLIVCGCGNNAGDGFALAQLLYDEGVACDVWLLSDRFSDDGSYYYNLCVQKNINIIENIDDITGYDIIVDCIFGTGFRNGVQEPYYSAIEKINNSEAYVVSADINSGMNGESGRIGRDSICIHSNLTVSIGNYKPGLFLADAKDVIEEKTNCDIGIEIIDDSFLLLEKSDVLRAFGKRKNNSHKGTYGYLALIGGCSKYSGAIRLANMAQSAMKSGAGVVKLAVPSGICDAVMPHLLESTLFPLKDEGGNIVFDELQLKELISGVSTVAVGMGIGNNEDTFRIIEFLLKNYEGKLIIDADGLNALAKDKDMLKKAKPCKIVLTPHPKEFSRLSGIDMDTVLDDPCIYAREFAKENGVIVLLKGSATVITDGNVVYISDRGSAGMATAGSGDVLSGVVAAMISYGEDALLSTAAASYVTGLAGELAAQTETEVSMVASDTVLHIGEAIKNIFS